VGVFEILCGVVVVAATVVAAVATLSFCGVQFDLHEI
jgi:hypothetical protein